MARGRTTSLAIRLTPAERQTLLMWQRSTLIPAGLARRSRIILLLAELAFISTWTEILACFAYRFPIDIAENG